MRTRGEVSEADPRPVPLPGLVLLPAPLQHLGPPPASALQLSVTPGGAPGNVSPLTENRKYFQFTKNIFAASTQVDLPEVSRYWLSEKGDVKISPGLRAVLQIRHVAIHTTSQLGPVWVQPALPARAISGDTKIIDGENKYF